MVSLFDTHLPCAPLLRRLCTLLTTGLASGFSLSQTWQNVTLDHAYHRFHSLPTISPQYQSPSPHKSTFARISIMSHTLTLSIPFILLGRHSILTPSTSPPLSLVHKALQQFCPQIPVLLWTPDPRTEQPTPFTPTQESTAVLGLGRSIAWLLRPAPYATTALARLDAAQGWREGDARLSPAETSMLDDGVWACPLLLQRFGVPVDTARSAWSRFVAETREMCFVLKAAFVDFEGPVVGVKGMARYWDVVFGASCFLRVVVDLDAYEADFDVGRKVVMLQAAFERELDMLKSTREVVEFASPSRWLEGLLLGRLALEKREAWRELDRWEGRLGWKSGLGAEEERYRRTKGKEREWWDVVHDMENEDLLEQMHRLEQDHLRLGVSVPANEAGVPQIVVQGQRSTLDPDYLIAYIKLVTCVVDIAASCDAAGLAEKLEDMRHSRPAKLIDCFAGMLDFLTPGDPRTSQALHAAFLPHLTPSALPSTQTDRPPRVVDPFHRLRTHLEASCERSRKDMKLFMERYERAGGYMPTREEKLCAILEAEEERMRSARDKERQVHSKDIAPEKRVCGKNFDAPNPPMTDDKPPVVQADMEGIKKRVNNWLFDKTSTHNEGEGVL